MDSRVRRAFKFIAQWIWPGPPHKFHVERRPFCFYACIPTLVPFIYTGRKNLPNIFISPKIFSRWFTVFLSSLFFNQFEMLHSKREFHWFRSLTWSAIDSFWHINNNSVRVDTSTLSSKTKIHSWITSLFHNAYREPTSLFRGWSLCHFEQRKQIPLLFRGSLYIDRKSYRENFFPPGKHSTSH